jgi:hypothetical protein
MLPEKRKGCGVHRQTVQNFVHAALRFARVTQKRHRRLRPPWQLETLPPLRSVVAQSRDNIYLRPQDSSRNLSRKLLRIDTQDGKRRGKMRKLSLIGWGVLMLSMVLVSNLPAQEIISHIRGVVTDPSGAGVPDAEVKATNTRTRVSSVVPTRDDGRFEFLSLQPGAYDVTITKTGFRSFTAHNVTLAVNQVYDLAAQLEIGPVADSVQVEANPAQVESTVTQLGTVIDAQKIVDLPLIDRNWTSLEQLAPGVQASSDRFGVGAYATNGSQTQQNAFLIDGADSNDIAINTPLVIPSPDAIQEFNLVTSTMNAEFGRNSGGILNAIIKSGTNQFHGSAFEFFRDTSLNDPNFFNQPNVFHQNEFGGTLGGPIRKDKTFFFISYQGFFNREAQALPGNTLPTVFTQAQRNGYFPDIASSTTPSPFAMVGESGATYAAGTPYNVLFPSGHIPTADFNPISLNLMQKFVPLPNSPGNLYSYSPVSTNSDYQGIAKVDQHFGSKDTVWASTYFEDNPSSNTLSFGGGNLPGFGDVNTFALKTYAASWSHVFSPTTLNEFRASYVRENFISGEPQSIVQPSSLGFTGINPQDPSGAGVPFVGITGYFNLGFGYEGPTPRVDENYQLNESLSKVIGNHSLKFGFAGERFGVAEKFDYLNNGYYSFGGSGLYSTGDPGADFLLGVPDSYEQSSGNSQKERGYEYYLFVQDSWKATRSLTLNYGLGYQIDTPFNNTWDGGLAMDCLRPGEQSTVFPSAPVGLVFPGDRGCSTSGYYTHYDNFAPRFGFAYSPDWGQISGGKAQKFVIRGGFGIYFNQVEEETALQNLLSVPFGVSSEGIGDVGGNPSFANPFTDISTGQSIPNKFPFTAPKPGDPNVNFSFFEPIVMNTVSPNFTTPYAMNYNLNIQRELPAAMILQVGYVGAQGRHLEVAYEGNPITLAGQAACAADSTCVANRTLQPYLYPDHTEYVPGNIIASAGTQGTIGVSSYNSLQVSLNKRLTKRLTFTTAYTWSHSIDDGSGYEESSAQASSNPRGFNVYNATLSRGDSAFDAAHRFVASYDYELPHLGWKNAFVKYAVNGWRVSGITTLQTGFPFTPFDSTYRSLTCSVFTYYGCADGPNSVGFTGIYGPRNTTLSDTLNGTGPLPNYYFNPNNFTQQTIGTFGTTGRNSIHGPGINNTDLSLQKEIQFSEVRKIQLRLEAYNVFNHAQFYLPGNNIVSPDFGRVTSAASGRLIQLGAKFYF